MPHFYFDIDDGERSTRDDAGHVCADADAEAARREAIRTLTGIVGEALPDGANRDFTVKVTNALGVPVFEALMSFKSGWIGNHG